MAGLHTKTTLKGLIVGLDWGLRHWVTIVSMDGTVWGRLPPMPNLTPERLAILIVQTLPPNTVIVVEDLKGIRQRKFRKVPARYLPFLKLQQALKTIGASKNITVVKVPPARTSQTCPSCRYFSPANRQKGLFHCQRCGLKMDADTAAAWNLAVRGFEVLASNVT